MENQEIYLKDAVQKRIYKFPNLFDIGDWKAIHKMALEIADATWDLESLRRNKAEEARQERTD